LLFLYFFYTVQKTNIWSFVQYKRFFFICFFKFFIYTVQKTNILAQDMEVTTVIANLDPDLMFHSA